MPEYADLEGIHQDHRVWRAQDDLCSSPVAWAPGLLQKNSQDLDQSLVALINPTDSGILNASITFDC
ncbi:hypothetical protein HGM15179_011062 [Zosterops borbonicus]|uniref:Uncharacterized protein n=1 Tax=Zosterops borbonicus TaxID=364589 RepID=A0A8K1GDJ6_9PASS|nr:hypothetical protein HGM15179_011062 [Zosterops borbonicus]